MEVVRYDAPRRETWDAFVRSSKNGTFLFERAYMDYHADRFADASLLVLDEREGVLAVLPAHRSDGTLLTHNGLTYGGVVTGPSMTVPVFVRVFRALLAAMHADGVTELRYKTVPHIYHAAPADEDRHALFRAGATLVRRDVLSVIDYREMLPMQERRSRSLRRAQRDGLEVRETRDLETFWPVITRNLLDRYGTPPVHSVEEIRLLADRFPDRIRLFAAYRGDEMEAGVVVYVSRTVCHVQYPGTSERGRASGALDLVQRTLIDHFRTHVRYFDFGMSSEEGGHRLNEGLVAFKEGFGARTVVHDHYTLDVARGLEALPDV